MELSVVIPYWYGREHLDELLASLAAQEWPATSEVVFAVNGAEPRELDYLATWTSRIPGLRAVDATARRGTAAARNIGAAATSGRALLFVDDDDVLGAGYVVRMVAALEDHRFVCGAWDVERLNPPRLRGMRPSGQRVGPMTYYNFLPYAAGGTLGIRRELFDRVNGFDEEVWYSDCVDLCFRVQLETGAQLTFVDGALVHYRYRESLRETFSQARRWGRSEVEIYRRYRPYGLPRVSLRHCLLAWRGLGHLERLLRSDGRVWWIWILGGRLGRLEGSITERTLLPG